MVAWRRTLGSAEKVEGKKRKHNLQLKLIILINKTSMLIFCMLVSVGWCLGWNCGDFGGVRGGEGVGRTRFEYSQIEALLLSYYSTGYALTAMPPWLHLH